MKTVNGVCASAKIFTDNVEEYAMAQIRMLCDNPAFSGSRIRVMPDVHPGKVGTIGFTATVGERVLPNVVGADIGCGVTIAKLKQKKAGFQRLDKVIREQVPSGFQNRRIPHRFADQFVFDRLFCGGKLDLERAKRSLGTLGGGNHFIELDRDEDGDLYVSVHSGSRSLGRDVTEYYLREGQKDLKAKGLEVPYELTFLEGDLLRQYLHDAEYVREFAALSREAILDELAKGMKWKIDTMFSAAHNYIDFSGRQPVLRKGAVSAKKGETVIIPVHMRAGVILGTGLGNEDWNESAPHGAGRILKREDVGKQHTVSQFKAEMKGIYCSCIGRDTLDEAPFAYRDLKEIADAVTETVKIERILTPVYNFKAGSKKD